MLHEQKFWKIKIIYLSTFNFTLNTFMRHEINRVSILELNLLLKIENRSIPTLLFGVVNLDRWGMYDLEKKFCFHFVQTTNYVFIIWQIFFFTVHKSSHKNILNLLCFVQCLGFVYFSWWEENVIRVILDQIFLCLSIFELLQNFWLLKKNFILSFWQKCF